MGAGEGSPAHPPDITATPEAVMLSTSARAFPVPQLPDVEVTDLAVESRDALPAEEDVAGGLHQPLTSDDPLAIVLRTLSFRRSARAPTPGPPWPARTAARGRPGRACSRIQARVPTLPTPTTLRAMWT